MNIIKFCPKRIKPILLREQKTEALLVFIRTILEESIEGNDLLKITSNRDARIIQDTLLNLLNELKKYVVNVEYLQYVRINANKDKALSILYAKEAPLITYYNSLSKGVVSLISEGVTWIPEFIIISLLSEWILEEEKNISMYPFLKEFDYINLISLFDKARLDVKELDKERYEFENSIIMNMYKVSSKLIQKLKRSTFKTYNRKSKKRK